MTGCHTRWVRPDPRPGAPQRIAIREALAFGKALYDVRTALGLSVEELADKSAVTVDEVECIEEGGTPRPSTYCADSRRRSTLMSD